MTSNPGMLTLSGEKMKIVARLSSNSDADEVQRLLASHGIDSIVNRGRENEPIPSVYLGSSAGISVEVEDADGHLASDLIAGRNSRIGAEPTAPCRSYRLTMLIFAAALSLFSTPWYSGALIGCLIGFTLITIYNSGVDRGFQQRQRHLRENHANTERNGGD